MSAFEHYAIHDYRRMIDKLRDTMRRNPQITLANFSTATQRLLDSEIRS